jgi:hypothetical protein
MLMPDDESVGVMPSRETAWSLVAGCYAFLCGAVLMVGTQPVAGTLAGVLGIETGYPALLMAGPAALLGAGVWWAVVERQRAYSYRRGALFGGLTALATVAAWVLRSLEVWGFELVATGWFVIAWLLATTGIAGLLVGVPLMYARRRQVGDATVPR